VVFGHEFASVWKQILENLLDPVCVTQQKLDLIKVECRLDANPVLGKLTSMQTDHVVDNALRREHDFSRCEAFKLDQVAVKKIADSVVQELDWVLDVFVLQLGITHLVRATCSEHVVGEEVDVADRVLKVVWHSCLKHLHHFNLLAGFLK
jgi:hypothetical protein